MVITILAGGKSLKYAATIIIPGVEVDFIEIEALPLSTLVGFSPIKIPEEKPCRILNSISPVIGTTWPNSLRMLALITAELWSSAFNDAGEDDREIRFAVFGLVYKSAVIISPERLTFNTWT